MEGRVLLLRARYAPEGGRGAREGERDEDLRQWPKRRRKRERSRRWRGSSRTNPKVDTNTGTLKDGPWLGQWQPTLEITAAFPGDSTPPRVSWESRLIAKYQPPS